MNMEFIITPHSKNIIIGRKEGRGEDDVLLCSAKKCLHEDKGDGREIVVLGFIKCPRCNNKVNYPEDLGEFNPEKQEATTLICSACHKSIPLKDDKGIFTVTFIQSVVSRHRRSKHNYYHGECWDAIFIGSEEK